MKDFEASLEFLWITPASTEMITMSSMPPDPKTIKRKALLCIKARQELEELGEDGEFFPTGIEKEVIFMEITGKLLTNLYSSCQVSQFELICAKRWCQSTSVDLKF